MVKQSPKMTALVVSAIRNLREVQGSTPREILNYIMSEYNASKPTNDAAIQRKLCTALKRGLDYGILKCVHGHYCLNTDPETVSPMEDMMGPMDRGHRGCKSAMRKKRKRRARGSGRKGCKSRSGRRRKRAAGGRKRRRGGGKRSKCGSRSRRKSRGRSRKSRKSKCGKRRGHKRSGRKSRRPKSKCAGRRGGEDIEMLAKDPVENRHRENIGGGYAYDRERDRSQSRGRQSRSRTRSPSHSRSSGSSDREDNSGNRGDRQVE